MNHPIRTLTAREIECRISQIKANGLQLLLYKDARCDMAILDETFGPLNWQRHHSRDNANCTVSIWDEEKRCWVDKEDTGTESNTEAEKGLASDSFKRACVNIGIGRELYTAPFIWINSANCEIKDEQGRYKCFDRFEVSDIGYNDHREINRLVIINSRTHATVYEYGTKAAEPAPEVTAPTCERCGSIIMGVKTQKEEFSAPEIISKSKLNFGGVYCLDCMKALKKSKEAREQ
jgi:hypothetical protein